MRTLEVELGERTYLIRIERGLLDGVGPEMKRLGFTGQVAVISNPVVGPLYAKRLIDSLKASGMEPLLVEVPDGEEYKTLSEVSRIYDRLLEERFERSSPVIALGGGVIGDMAGFVAATYLRGVPYIQVPTTLLSQVDSSVGGKTGVNHPMGKNLIGAFYQPRAVFIDPDVLKTLEERDFSSGLAEVVKYGVIWDESFFHFLEENAPDISGRGSSAESLSTVIERSCAIKASVVAEDELEHGLRSILNLGHTFGHAIEAVTGYTTFRHGEAVSIGMVMAAGLSLKLGLCSEQDCTRIEKLLLALGLPKEVPDIAPRELIASMQTDKKVKHGILRFVLVRGIGSVQLKEVAQEDLESYLL